MRALDQCLVRVLAGALLVSLLGAAVTAQAQHVRRSSPTLIGVPPLQTAARPPQATSPAAVVSAFVETLVRPRVVVLEGTLATADRQVLAYRDELERYDTLRDMLTVHARAAQGAGYGLSSLTAPAIGTLPERQMERLLEDLALCAGQLTSLLQDTAARLAREPMSGPLPGEETADVLYAPRVSSIVTSLRRAEAWLETIDHETGAHATLPGFEPGAPSLESQLALP